MKYTVLIGSTPVEVVNISSTTVVATGHLEAVKIAMRSVQRRGYLTRVLSENGDNVFVNGCQECHYLVRVSDGNGVLCVMPITTIVVGDVDFPKM